jgi:hypothetical protein
LHFRVDVELRELLPYNWSITHAALARQVFDHTDQAVQAHALAYTATFVAQGRDGDAPTRIDLA